MANEYLWTHSEDNLPIILVEIKTEIFTLLCRGQAYFQCVHCLVAVFVEVTILRNWRALLKICSSAFASRTEWANVG